MSTEAVEPSYNQEVAVYLTQNKGVKDNLFAVPERYTYELPDGKIEIDSSIILDDLRSKPVKREPQIIEFQTKLYITIRFLLWFLSTLTVCSLVFSITPLFRMRLSMERSSYWWYFLYCLFLCVVSLPLHFFSNKINRKHLFCCILSLFAIIIFELLVLSRFVLVTFPLPDIHEKMEPICLNALILLRIITATVLVLCFIRH